MPVSGPARRPGCESCRARHIKCDKGAPCGQCVRKGKACVRGTKLRFKHITVPSGTDGHRGEPQYEFSETQKWCRVSGKRIRFIDETTDINIIHNDGSDSDDDILSTVTQIDLPPSPEKAPSLPQPTRRDPTDLFVEPSPDNHLIPNPAVQESEEPGLLPIERGQPYPLTKLPALHPHAAFRSPSSSHLALDDLPRTISPVPRSHFSGPIGSISDIDSGSLAEDPSLPEPRRSFHSAGLPLTDRREAQLVRHYMDFIAAPFDYGDPHKRMSTLIPQRAALSPALLNAVLALSAKTSDVDGCIAFFDKPAERYYETALELLAPVLGKPLQEVDETHVAAAVLLRLYQILDVVLLEEKIPTMIWDFLRSGTRTPEKGSLVETALRAWIRIEIFRSAMRHEPLDIQLEHLDFDRSLQPADDDVWAWRMCLLTVDILNYCYGGSQDPAVYDHLASYAAKWMSSAPESFTPVFVRGPPLGGFFPEILFINDSVVMGHVYYHLNRILLTIHNPDASRLAKLSKRAACAIDNEILTDVKIICGIEESNVSRDPAYIHAGMAIALAGHRSKIREEQEALYGVFATGANGYGWDSGLILRRFRETWGWLDPEDLAF